MINNKKMQVASFLMQQAERDLYLLSNRYDLLGEEEKEFRDKHITITSIKNYMKTVRKLTLEIEKDLDSGKE